MENERVFDVFVTKATVALFDGHDLVEHLQPRPGNSVKNLVEDIFDWVPRDYRVVSMERGSKILTPVFPASGSMFALEHYVIHARQV
jgi:hypothetical protein